MAEEVVAVKVSEEAQALLVGTVKHVSDYGTDPTNTLAHLLRAVYDGLPETAVQ